MINNLTGKVTIHIAAPPQKVWAGLTTPSIIKKYFFNTDAISDWKVGSLLVFRGEWEGKKYEDHGIILDSIPEKMFRYKYWSSLSGKEDIPENYANITYELKATDDGTELTITQDNIADEKTKTHSEENWKKVMNGLKEILENDRQSK